MLTKVAVMEHLGAVLRRSWTGLGAVSGVMWRSWVGLGLFWDVRGGGAILRRLDAVLGPRTSSCSQKWPSWSILGQS